MTELTGIADAQRIDRSVAGHVSNILAATDDAAVVEALEGLGGRLDADRRKFANQLRRAGSIGAKVALVMLWGAARTDHAVAAAVGPGTSDRVRREVWDRAERCRGAVATADELQRTFLALWEQPRFRRARVRGAGVSFGTKLLYWAARSVDEETVSTLPLIYDARVARSLQALDPSIRWPMPTSGLPRETYAAYCLTASRWAAELGCHPDDVEVALFRGPDEPSWLEPLRDASRGNKVDIPPRVAN